MFTGDAKDQEKWKMKKTLDEKTYVGVGVSPTHCTYFIKEPKDTWLKCLEDLQSLILQMKVADNDVKKTVYYKPGHD